MKQLTTLLLSFLCASGMLNAQVKATVMQGGEAVAFANAMLYSLPDSAVAKVGYTEDDGTLAFVNVDPGEYFINVTYVGLEDYNSESIKYKGGDLNVGQLDMVTSSNELGEVTVRAKKKLIEVLPDKMRFNIEGSINAQGNTALDLLRKSPGVVVDNEENLSLMGKNGVRVYINGRPSVLGGSDLASFLKGLNSNDIASIDIITNPSARYEAEGNAGIIDIILKKNIKHGTNATVNLGLSQGITPKGNGSVSANYRNDDVNVFGNYSYNRGIYHNWADFYREQVGNVYEAANDILTDRMSHNVRIGTDFFINDESTIGVLASTNLNDMLTSTDTYTDIRAQGSEDIDRVLVSSNDDEGTRNNYDFNLNYQYKTKEGRVLSADADYGMYQSEMSGMQPNTYYQGDGQTIESQVNYSTNTPINIDIYSFKLDYEKPSLGGVLSYGVKSRRVVTDNEYAFYNVTNNGDELDMTRSNKFLYDEWVNAGYMQYQKQFGKIGVNAGLRAEHTMSEGELMDFNDEELQTTPRDYLDFFPSAGISYAVNRKNSMNLAYSRRVDRPNYQDLNPFEFKLSELSFRKGNAFLNPQYTHNVQISNTYNYRLNTTLSYSYVDDFFAQLIDTIENEASFITKDNLAKRQVYNLNVSYPFSPRDWWNVFLTTGGTYSLNEADFGDGRKVDVKVPFLNFYGQTSFLLPYNLSFELDGWYRSSGVWGGTFESDPMGGIGAGLQWKFDEDRGNVKFSVGDILNTMQWGGMSDYGAQYVTANGGWESRQYKLNLSYTFGNVKVKKSRNRKTGLDDEKGRLNEGGGNGPG